MGGRRRGASAPTRRRDRDGGVSGPRRGRTGYPGTPAGQGQQEQGRTIARNDTAAVVSPARATGPGEAARQRDGVSGITLPARRLSIGAAAPRMKRGARRAAEFAIASMSQTQVILCDRSGRWAHGLARRLPPGLRLWQVRSLAECTDRLTAAPTSLVALEVTTATLSGVVAWLEALPRRFPLARSLALAEPKLCCFEWLLREAGVVHWLTSPRELSTLRPLVQRHVARLPASRATLAQQVWDSLPWADSARA